ncbi:hypothetical protein BDW42DRAFT_77724 [Aspergillus taichungensis]|uniref:Rhodopsin domain-containing protein n=1 Tax=Aspergillus taichungensis TaxID=482145 RepID=A0A2J5HYU0_9EURO|nr:hypothetical protein BDW42DRAFT_77724 [Aspergillus taichungensis]
MGNVSPTPKQLITEGAIFWSIAVVLFIGRLVSRIVGTGSIKHLNFEDYTMCATFVVYTSLLVLIPISSLYATNLMDPADYNKVLADPIEVNRRIIGSKIVIGLEQCMLFSTWGVKTCMLTMFWRLTKNLRLHLFVKCIAVYVVVGFVVIMVTYYGVYCRPFSQYWAMPVHDMQCATYQHYSITQAVFNISSDAAMLAVPVPLLIQAQMRMRKKVLLICIMSLGLFTVVAAILNKVYNFASPLTTTYQIWYIREASTGIYVANLVCLWPLLRKLFGFKAFQNSGKQYRQHLVRPSKECSGATRSAGTSRSRPSFSLHQTLHLDGKGPHVLAKSLVPGRKKNEQRSSQEAITRSSHDDYADDHIPLEVWDKGGRQPDPEIGVVGDNISRTSSHSGIAVHGKPLQEPRSP